MEGTNTNVEKTYTDPITGKFIKGNPGGGRPRGSISIRDKVRQFLEDNPNEVDEIVKHFVIKNRELMWQMLEGKPKQQMEVDVDKDTLFELTQFFKLMAQTNEEKGQGDI